MSYHNMESRPITFNTLTEISRRCGSMFSGSLWNYSGPFGLEHLTKPCCVTSSLVRRTASQPMRRLQRGALWKNVKFKILAITADVGIYTMMKLEAKFSSYPYSLPSFFTIIIPSNYTQKRRSRKTSSYFQVWYLICERNTEAGLNLYGR